MTLISVGFTSEPEKVNELNKSLLQAAAKGDIAQVKSHLSKGADVNAKDKRGQTVLHNAVREGHSAVTELLISKGANVNAKDMFGWTALHFAMAQGLEEVVKLLIASGGDVNAKDKNGDTPLHLAVELSRKALVKLLLTKGADINVRREDGSTPLHIAAEKGRKNLAEFLIANGADVKAKKMDGSTPLYVATKAGHCDLAEILIIKGADVNAKSKESWTPLHLAANFGRSDVAVLLIVKGADVNAKDRGGRTALHYAASQEGSEGVAKLLIAEGAEVNAKNKSGWTPLHWASNKAVAEFLIAKGTDVNAKDNWGQTPLHCAGLLKTIAELNLKEIPFKLLYETYRETDGRDNWELYLINADGSNATNLTQTPDVDEMYAHASPDGTKVCFVADEGTGKSKVRNIYYMNIDGTGRVKVTDGAGQPCWNPDGNMIAYLKDEYERYNTRAYATTGVFFYDIATGRHEQHPNKDLQHLYNICWPADGKWFVGTVHGGMGFGHSIIAFEVQGTGVFDLAKYGIKGCRQDLSSDGMKITWGQTDSELCVAYIDLTLPLLPRVADVRSVIKCRKGYYVSHTDFSPDGRYIAFGYGPWAEYSVGSKTPGWNICISDLSGKWVQITTDGNHNKEPDWVPITTKR